MSSYTIHKKIYTFNYRHFFFYESLSESYDIFSQNYTCLGYHPVCEMFKLSNDMKYINVNKKNYVIIVSNR